jgi:hypothetical protein
MCSNGLMYGRVRAFGFLFWKDRKSTTPGMPCVESILVTDSALHLHICRAVSRRNSSMSSAGPDVALKAPATVCAAATCRLFSVSIVFRVCPSALSIDIDQAEHPYIICGRITADISVASL